MATSAASLLKAVGLARIAQVIPRIADPLQSPVKAALLGLMLPSLHLLNLVSVLDEALSEYIESKEVQWPPSAKRDLLNRINVVSLVLPSLDRTRLHELRKARNLIAHSLDTQIEQSFTWVSLDDAITAVSHALVAMGMIDVAPNVQGFFERVPTLFPDALGPNGERVRYKHRVGARLDGEVLLEFSTEVGYLPASAP